MTDFQDAMRRTCEVIEESQQARARIGEYAAEPLATARSIEQVKSTDFGYERWGDMTPIEFARVYNEVQRQYKMHRQTQDWLQKGAKADLEREYAWESAREALDRWDIPAYESWMNKVNELDLNAGKSRRSIKGTTMSVPPEITAYNEIYGRDISNVHSAVSGSYLFWRKEFEATGAEFAKTRMIDAYKHGDEERWEENIRPAKTVNKRSGPDWTVVVSILMLLGTIPAVVYVPLVAMVLFCISSLYLFIRTVRD